MLLVGRRDQLGQLPRLTSEVPSGVESYGQGSLS